MISGCNILFIEPTCPLQVQKVVVIAAPPRRDPGMHPLGHPVLNKRCVQLVEGPSPGRRLCLCARRLALPQQRLLELDALLELLTHLRLTALKLLRWLKEYSTHCMVSCKALARQVDTARRPLAAVKLSRRLQQLGHSLRAPACKPLLLTATSIGIYKNRQVDYSPRGPRRARAACAPAPLQTLPPRAPAARRAPPPPRLPASWPPPACVYAGVRDFGMQIGCC